MKIPDKYTHKATITNKLREDLIKFSKEIDNSSYLEIGFDKGFTIASLVSYFKSIVGIDISEERNNEAKNFLSENKNVTLICGDATNISLGDYNVILIDADHSYKNVLFDTFNVLSKNTSKDPFIIVYHDYGLVNAGVKKFCDQYFSDFMKPVGEKSGWNPLGGAINDQEAMACIFDADLKEKYLNIFKGALA
jgi:hypothetical protein